MRMRTSFRPTSSNNRYSVIGLPMALTDLGIAERILRLMINSGGVTLLNNRQRPHA